MRQQFSLLLRIADSLLRALSAAYGLNLALFLLLRWTVGESWPLVAFFNSFLHLLILPAPPLLLIFLARRQWRIAALLIPAALVFVTAYGPLFLPRTVEAQPAAPRLRVMLYNMHKDTQDLDTLLSIMRESRADVIALQELNPQVAAAIESELGALYPHQALHPKEDFAGQGLLSRFPILEDAFWVIELGHQRVKLDMGQSSVVLYNTHPVHPFRRWSFDSEVRNREIGELLRRAAQESGPVIIAGDLNMTDQAEHYAQLTARFMDVWRAVGRGLGHTFPEIRGLPLLARIDYIFISPHFRALDAQIWPTSGGSDHRPLWADLVLVEAR